MKRVAVLAVCALLLAGCSPVAREPDDLALARVLGVDGTAPVTLVAVSGADTQGETIGGIVTADGFRRGKEALPWSGTAKELSLTGVSYLVVGPDVDLKALVFMVLEDEALGAAITVWLAAEGAGDLLASCEDPAADLELLVLRGVNAPTVAQAAAAISGGEELSLPCLVAEDKRLKERGEISWEGMQSDYPGGSSR